jgi:hypothetical protein
MKSVHYTLRVASACCFIGHGIFGLITKSIWCNYFGVFGVGHDLAYRLMPVVGSIDILLGLSLLVYPVRAVFAWLVVWGLFTAALRPLSGEPFAEMLERAGNFGAPLAFLLLAGLDGAWFRRVRATGGDVPSRVRWCLRVAGFLLLAGHGWLNLLGKKGLLDQYATLGFAHPTNVSLATGLFEVLSAVWLLVFPSRPLLVILLAWKVASELWYPHYELVEWVERGGSYGVLLALLLSVWKMDRIASPSSAPRNILGSSV